MSAGINPGRLLADKLRTLLGVVEIADSTDRWWVHEVTAALTDYDNVVAVLDELRDCRAVEADLRAQIAEGAV